MLHWDGTAPQSSHSLLLCILQINPGDIVSVSLSLGLVVRTAPLEGEPQPREPHALGEPLYHPPLPEPSPAREGCDLWGRVETSPQWAHAARGPAPPWASAGQRPLLPLTWAGRLVAAAVKGQRGTAHPLPLKGVSCRVSKDRGPCSPRGGGYGVRACVFVSTHAHVEKHEWEVESEGSCFPERVLLVGLWSQSTRGELNLPVRKHSS